MHPFICTAGESKEIQAEDWPGPFNQTEPNRINFVKNRVIFRTHLTRKL